MSVVLRYVALVLVLAGCACTAAEAASASLTGVSVSSCTACYAAVGVALAVVLAVVLRSRRGGMRTKKDEQSPIISDPNPSAKAMHDVIIIGGGVAGASMAAFLARHGKKVFVVERDFSEPDRIVGELMQPGGIEQMHQLGLEDCLEGFDAAPVDGYGILFRDKRFEILYPQMNGKNQFGCGFHNGRFIMALRARARSEKGVEMVEGTVSKLLEANGRITGVSYRPKDKQTSVEARAPLTIVCDGCHSIFRRALSDGECTCDSYFLGMILKDVTLPYPGKGNVVLTDPTPLLMYPISSNEARILIDFPKLPSVANGDMERVLLEKVMPQLPTCVHQSFKNAVALKDFKSMPNRILPARPLHVSGAVLLGDSLNMRHPLTGGGMTVALTDVNLLGQRLAVLGSLKDAAAVDKAVAEFYSSRVQPAASINILSVALYKVFSQSNDDLRQACYAYLRQGGHFARGPMKLLSGISRRQIELVIHFFAVAFYGAVFTLKPFPTPGRLIRAYKMIRAAVGIIMPMAEQENDNIVVTTLCRLIRMSFWV